MDERTGGAKVEETNTFKAHEATQAKGMIQSVLAPPKSLCCFGLPEPSHARFMRGQCRPQPGPFRF